MEKFKTLEIQKAQLRNSVTTVETQNHIPFVSFGFTYVVVFFFFLFFCCGILRCLYELALDPLGPVANIAFY
jgi:hypothetical protein